MAHEMYAIVTWSKDDKRGIPSVEYRRIGEESSLENSNNVISPNDLNVILNEESIYKKKSPLMYLLSKRTRGLVFACRYGLMSLFEIALYRFQMYRDDKSMKTMYENTCVEAMRAAIEGGHRQIFHRCRIELMDPNLYGFACDCKKLDILIYEYPHMIETLHCFFIEHGDEFGSILDEYKAKMDDAEFKDMINKTLNHATDWRYLEIVRLLIANGADDYEEPIGEAARKGSNSIVDMMMENVDDEAKLDAMKRSALLGASKSINFEILQKYYVDGVLDLKKVLNGSCREEVWKFCIDKGATIDNDVIRRFMSSKENDNINYLIDMDCDITEMIKIAIENRDTENVLFLAEYGKDSLDYGNLLVFAMKTADDDDDRRDDSW